MIFLQNLFLRIVGFDFYVRPHKDYPNDTPKPTYKPASLGIPIGISYCFDFGLLLELNHVPTLGTTSYTQLAVGYRF